MRTGFAVLAHSSLDRAAALVRHLAGSGAPVAVHLDAGLPGDDIGAFRRAVGSDVEVISRHRAEWGRAGMVEATLALAQHLMNHHPELGHVALLSGACLPLKPMAELDAHLAEHAGTDFIESVPVRHESWVRDGLSGERFTLYHPFSHRDQPWLFSRSVDLQRWLRIERRLPAGLEPHLGMQWWCLSTQTLRAILQHPSLPYWRRFFRLSWIPDEGFFQTIVRHLRPDAEPRPPLHLMRFNARGRPIVFHDDHLPLFCRAPEFFARKIDPDAGQVYETLLGTGISGLGEHLGGPWEEFCEAALSGANTDLSEEGRGLLSQSRLPNGTSLTKCDTHRPYLAIVADEASAISEGLQTLRRQAHEAVLHGRLFSPGRPAEFAGGSDLYPGNLSCDPDLRDYRAAQFLGRLVWLDRERPMAFLLAPGDAGEIRYQLIRDPNARLLFLTGKSRAGELMDDFCRPFGGRGPGARRKLDLHAWVRVLEADADLDSVASVLSEDWANQHGWSVP